MCEYFIFEKRLKLLRILAFSKLSSLQIELGLIILLNRSKLSIGIFILCVEDGLTLVVGGGELVEGGLTLVEEGLTLVEGGRELVEDGFTLVEGGLTLVEGGRTPVDDGGKLVEVDVEIGTLGFIVGFIFILKCSQILFTIHQA